MSLGVVLSNWFENVGCDVHGEVLEELILKHVFNLGNAE